MIAVGIRDVSVKWFVVSALMLLALEIDPDVDGLSKGPSNPADIGTRCAVMAGREDRAYLSCAEQATRPSGVSDGRDGSSPDQPRLDQAGHEHSGRRYPLRRR